jgi:16S rRNA (cytidine1402-2'-O)-methyltransferase
MGLASRSDLLPIRSWTCSFRVLKPIGHTVSPSGRAGRSPKYLARRNRVSVPPERIAGVTNSVTGALVLAATPIGDPQDAAPRLAHEIVVADVVAAEDTRRFSRLCRALEVRPSGSVVSYHEHNEATRTTDLLARLVAGARVLVVTDAGMPSVSDPGYRLVVAAVEAGVRVTCVPGPSAVLMALAVSGLPVDRFCFEGFPSRKAGERLRSFQALARERRTLVFFEAPHRLDATLAAMAEVFGRDRPAAVCRELTKTYEEVKRGPLGDLAAWAAGGVKGEITVVVGGAPATVSDPDTVVAGIRARVAGGERLKDVCAEVAAASGLSRNDLYNAALAAGRRRDSR